MICGSLHRRILRNYTRCTWILQNLSPTILSSTCENTQKYSQVLWTSGGQLAPLKCNVYLLHPKWRRDKCSFAPIAELPGSVEVRLDPLSQTRTPLNRLEPTEAHRTLGVYIAPDRSTGTQTTILAQKITKWQQGLRYHGLTEKDRWRAYDSCLKPALLYPLIGHSYRASDLQKLQISLDGTLTNALHLNRHFPRALFHGSSLYAGIGVPTLLHHHWADKIVTFLHHLRANDTVGKQLQISLANTQLEVGSAFLFLLLDWNQWHSLATPPR